MAKDQKIEKANNFSGTLKRIIKLMFTQYKVSSILIVFFALASTVFGIVGPKIMGQATTELFEGLVAKISNEGSINFEKIAGILLTVLGLYILSSLFMFIQGWLMSNISQQMTYDIRKDISKKINTLPVGYFEQRTVGETLSRVTNDVDTLGQSLNQSFTQIISNTATVLGVLVMMFTISPLMTLIALALIPVSGILLGVITKWSQKYFRSQQKILSDVNGQVEESFSGQNIIAAFNYKEKSVKEFNDKNKQLYTSSWKANFFSGLMFPVINFVGNLGYVGIVFSGGLLVSKGTIGVGDIQAFIQYIKNFTSDVKKGEMIAIVGPTGAGKTTMVKLLMRFYDINGGNIYIDGKDISKLDRAELRSYFTMVLQDTWLFKGTIMENLRYGRLDATDEEVIEAAKAAHIHHFIKTLPGGYDMELNEDASNISQGQKQLLTIARAILADKPILILDEATSSVDTRTEVLIQKAMNKLMEGRTTFVIAHRLSTIRNADKILVLKDGDIIEQGNHDELLEQKGFYSELYQSQFAE